jgi:hypothetical protein
MKLKLSSDSVLMGLVDRLLDEARDRAVEWIRDKIANTIYVGEYDDRGIAHPGKEKGAGYAIYFGEWRIGWWPTREEACDEAEKISEAIKRCRIDS